MLVIFDFDGTLADSYPWFVGALGDLSSKYGFKRVSLEEAESLRCLGHQAIMQRLGIKAWQVPLLVQDLRKQATLDAHLLPCFLGMDEVVRQLAQANVTLGLVSSNSAETISQFLDTHRMNVFSEYSVGVSLSGKAKRLSRLWKKTGHSEAMYIGDEIRDIHSAREAAIDSGAVSWGYNTAESLMAQGPTCFFHHPGDIVKYLLED